MDCLIGSRRLDLTNGDHGVQIQMQLQQQPGQLLPAKHKAINKGFQRKNKGEGLDRDKYFELPELTNSAPH